MSPSTTSTTTSTSTTKKAILTPLAPAPLAGILNQAIVAPPGAATVYCSGALGVDARTGKLIAGSVGDRTHQCIRNLTAVLEAAGTDVEHVVKVNVFLDDMRNFEAMNEVYKLYWGENKPCRTCVAVKQLPMATDVEIECVAILPGSSKL